MKKFLLILLFLFLGAGAFVYAARETLLRKGFEYAVTSLTGFETHVGNIHIQIPEAVIHLEDLKIHNPKSFKKDIFVDIPEIYVAPDLAAILKKESIHFREIRFAVKEVNVVKDEQGVSNISRLSSIGQSGAAKQPAQPAPKEKASALPFKVDKLVLTLRKVSFEDHSAGLAGRIPKDATVDLHVDKQVYTNITDPNAIVNILILKILYGTTFGNLLDIDPTKLTQNLTKTVGASADTLLQTTDELLKTTEGVVQGTVGTAKGVLNDTTRAVRTGDLTQATKTTQAVVKDTLGQATNLFGKFKSKLTTQSGSSETTSTDSESSQ
ncbi:MAG: hypothetical protein A2036_03785 [Omnitrophica bacterium GWA2_50_21]|nr:MAG: hypothetical protein A2036_03785 [Omnitrophica bacterium GWA2_50_21]